MKTSKQIFWMIAGAMGLWFVLAPEKSPAYHNFFFRDAGDLVSGILNNALLDPSSVTKLGPSIGGSEIDDNSIIGRNIALGTILSSHTAFSLNGSVDYFLKISTDSTGFPDLSGGDRLPFMAAVSSAGLLGNKATILVRRGTYTIENVVSDGITWLCEEGVVFRRANNKMMFRMKNGGIVGGIIISTADPAVLIATPAFVFESNSFLKDTRFLLLQTNQGEIVVEKSSACVIQIGSATNVVFDNVTITSATNFTLDGTDSRAEIITVNCSTFTMRNSYIKADFPALGVRNVAIKVQHSNTIFEDNTFDVTNGGGILFVDLAVGSALYTSRYRVLNNTFFANDNNTGANGSVLASACSTNSFISGNRFYPTTDNAVGIYVVAGGLNDRKFSDFRLTLANNTMTPPNNVNQPNSTLILVKGADSAAHGLRDLFVFGNVANLVSAVYGEGTTTTNTSLRTNRLNGAAVTDSDGGVAASVSQSASTSSALIGLLITTQATDTNKVFVQAKEADIMGCFFSDPSTAPAISTVAAMNLVNTGGALGGGSNLSDPANTWHKIFLIAKTDCSTYSVILDSSNISNPVLPSGFTKWRKVGTIYNDSSSNILPIYKTWARATYWTDTSLVADASAGTTWTDVNLETVLSPNARNFTFGWRFQVAGTTSRCMFKFKGHLHVLTDLGEGDQGKQQFDTSVSMTKVYASQMTMPIFNSRIFQYRTDSAGGCELLDITGISYEEDN